MNEVNSVTRATAMTNPLINLIENTTEMLIKSTDNGLEKYWVAIQLLKEAEQKIRDASQSATNALYS